MTVSEIPAEATYAAPLLDYIFTHHPSIYTADSLPRDESLLALGVIDSAGFVELLMFIESAWEIEISDEDITNERMGSFNKILAVVKEYVLAKA